MSANSLMRGLGIGAASMASLALGYQYKENQTLKSQILDQTKAIPEPVLTPKEKAKTLGVRLAEPAKHYRSWDYHWDRYKINKYETLI